jgi:GAF domain-containing protein
LALVEFSGASGIAIFLDREGVGMELCHATLPNAPAVIDTNHDVVIDLRHTRQLVRLDDGVRDLPGDLALPMMTQGRLRGLVLMGAKPDQQQYRPDELALLATAVQQLGMDLESLHAAELEQAYAVLERETSLLRELIHRDRSVTAIAPLLTSLRNAP